MLDFVDGVARVLRRRPIKLRAASGGCVALKRFMMRNGADDGAHDVENVERWHPRACATDVEPRKRKPEAIGRGADRESKQEALGLRSCVLHDEAGVEWLTHLPVEQQWIFPQLLWEQALGQAGDEDDLERAAARLVRTADEYPTVTIRRGVLVERAQALCQNVARLFE